MSALSKVAGCGGEPGVLPCDSAPADGANEGDYCGDQWNVFSSPEWDLVDEIIDGSPGYKAVSSTVYLCAVRHDCIVQKNLKNGKLVCEIDSQSRDEKNIVWFQLNTDDPCNSDQP